MRDRSDLDIYTGDQFLRAFAFGVDDGVDVDDLVIVSGDDSATSESGVFTPSMDGMTITAINGVGIPDGTTVTYVSPTELTLSANATASLGSVVAAIGVEDCSGFTDHKAQMKYDRRGPVVAEFNVDAGRSDAGLFVITMDAADTDDLTRNGVWDWQCVDADGPHTLKFGKVTVTEGVTT